MTAMGAVRILGSELLIKIVNEGYFESLHVHAISLKDLATHQIDDEGRVTCKADETPPKEASKRAAEEMIAPSLTIVSDCL